MPRQPASFNRPLTRFGIAVGLDERLRGAFTDYSAKLTLPQWYGQSGQFVTTKFFGMKENKYLHDHDISQTMLNKIAAKNYRNGALNPNTFLRKPMIEDEIIKLNCAMLLIHAMHVLCVRRGCCRHDCVPRLYGAYNVYAAFAPFAEDASPVVYVAKVVYESAGIGPEDIGLVLAAGHRCLCLGHPHGRDGPVR